MSEDTYKTIATLSEGIYTEKRSKFIAIALPVRTVEEVKAHLETYQKKYYDARTCVTPTCWAMSGRTSVPTTTASHRVRQASRFWDKSIPTN